MANLHLPMPSGRQYRAQAASAGFRLRAAVLAWKRDLILHYRFGRMTHHSERRRRGVSPRSPSSESATSRTENPVTALERLC